MRDYRIDFFRGLALVIIFVDHIPYNFWNHLTPRNYGISDAAEMFVLIAGISSAYAYFGRYASGAPLLASALAVKRAVVLYIAHLSGTLIILGLFAMGAVVFSLPNLLVDNNVAPVFEDPARAIVGLVGLGHQIGFFNILPMYMVLLLMLPGIMYLTQRAPMLALTVSFILYFVAGTWQLDLPNFPQDGGWYFNPLAWQFLFTIGLVAGARLRAGKPVPYSPFLFGAAIVYLVGGAIWVLFGMYGKLPDFGLPFVLYHSDKTYLTANRLLHVLAAAYVIGHSPIAGWLKERLRTFNPLVLIGRYGLVSFCAATFLSMIGLVLKQAADGGFIFDTVALVVGLGLMVAIAAALELMRKPPPVVTGEGAVPAGAILRS